MEQLMQMLESMNGSYVDTYIGLLRYVAPALAIFCKLYYNSLINSEEVAT